MTNNNKSINKRKDVKSQLYWNTLLRIPSQMIRFVLSIIIARLLVPNDFGILAIAMMAVNYANLITNFGFNEALIQRRIKDKKIIDSIFTADLIISLLLAGIVLSIAGYIAMFFNSPESKNAIRILSLMFIITTFYGLARAILRRDMDFKTVSIMDITLAISTSIVTLILAMNDFQYWSLIYGQLIPHLIVTVGICIKIKWVPALYYSHSSMKPIYNFGVWNFLKTQVEYVTQYIDKLIIGRFLGTASLGFYDKSMNIAKMPLESFTSSINSVMFSSFSNDKEYNHELQIKFKKTLSVISLINMPIYFGLIAIAPYFVYALLGNKWTPMIVPFHIILIACIFRSFGGLIASLNVAVGKYKKHTLLNLLSSAILIISCFILISFGINGVSAGFLLYCIIVIFLTMSLAISNINILWKDVIYSILPGLIGSTIMFAIMKALSYFFLTEYTLLNTLILIGTGILTYVSCLFIDKTEVTVELRNGLLSDMAKKYNWLIKGEYNE